MTKFFYGYWILMVSFLCQVISHGFVFYSFSLYVTPLFGEFGWGRAGIMAAATIIALTMGAASPLVGRAIVKYGVRRVIAFGTLLSGLSFVLLSLTETIWHFYLFSAGLGIGSAAMGVVPTSTVIADWFRERRGWALGVLGMGIGVGGFLMPIVVGVFFIPSFGWRNAYLASGLVTALLATPLVLLVMKQRPVGMNLLPEGTGIPKKSRVSLSAKSITGEGLDFSVAIKTAAFWSIAMTYVAFGMAMFAIFQNQVPHLEGIGFSRTIVASAMSLVGLGSAVGKFGFGWLCDFIHAKYVLVIGISLEVAALMLLMTIEPTSPLALLWIYAAIFGVSVGCWLPSLSMMVSTTFGLASYGVIFGVMHFLFQGSSAVGPFYAGLIYDATLSYYWAFILSLTLYIIALLTILLAYRPRMERARLDRTSVIPQATSRAAEVTEHSSVTFKWRSTDRVSNF